MKEGDQGQDPHRPRSSPARWLRFSPSGTPTALSGRRPPFRRKALAHLVDVDPGIHGYPTPAPGRSGGRTPPRPAGPGCCSRERVGESLRYRGRRRQGGQPANSNHRGRVSTAHHPGGRPPQPEFPSPPEHSFPERGRTSSLTAAEIMICRRRMWWSRPPPHVGHWPSRRQPSPDVFGLRYQSRTAYGLAPPAGRRPPICPASLLRAKPSSPPGSCPSRPHWGPRGTWPQCNRPAGEARGEGERTPGGGALGSRLPL